MQKRTVVDALQNDVAQSLAQSKGVTLYKGKGKKAKQQSNHFKKLARARLLEMKQTPNKGISDKEAKSMGFVKNHIVSGDIAWQVMEALQLELNRDLSLFEAVRVIKGVCEDTHAFEVRTSSKGVLYIHPIEKEC